MREYVEHPLRMEDGFDDLDEDLNEGLMREVACTEDSTDRAPRTGF
jgi:hypothetical protein